MTDIAFRSHIAVTLVDDLTCGSDQDFAYAAWVIPPRDPCGWDHIKDVKEQHGKDDTEVGHRRVIRAMIRGHHTSPFEKGCMEVYVEAPGVVWWQWTRHRFMALATEDFSPNLESGRYKQLDGVFYLPPADRPILEPPEFRPMRPKLFSDEDLIETTCRSMRFLAGQAWVEYNRQLSIGVAREVARLVLPNWMLYCAGYIGARPLTWLHFFSKRKAGGSIATFPQYEIEQATAQCEDLFARIWPITYAEFVENGRVAP